uniref:Secreted protein n=1 Tax=Panagrellus redivivus TaxID=6233 RepID=A0A7E4VBB3_PANRE
MAPDKDSRMPFAWACLSILCFLVHRVQAQENHWMVNEKELKEKYGKVDPDFGLGYAMGSLGYVYDPKIVAPHFDYPDIEPNRLRVVNHDGYLVFNNEIHVKIEYGHCMTKPNGEVFSCFCYASPNAVVNKNCGGAVAASFCQTTIQKYSINGGPDVQNGAATLQLIISKTGKIQGGNGIPDAKIYKLPWFAAGSKEVPLAIKLVSPYPYTQKPDRKNPCSSLVFDSTKATFVGNLIGPELKSQAFNKDIKFEGKVNENIKKPNCDRRKKYCEKVCDDQKDLGVEDKKAGAAGVCRKRIAKNVFLGAGAAYVGQRVLS